MNKLCPDENINNLKSKAVVLLFVAVFVFFLLGNSVFAAEIVAFGEVDVRVYVVALDGVDGHCVENVTIMVEGILEASRVNTTLTRISSTSFRFGELKININVTVVYGWNNYEEIVEACSKVIIINAHGETVPVPLGYTKEEWVDKIAEAMLKRRVTWVHTAGYPFYYAWHQGADDKELWGEDGFKRLMSHINKGDVTLPTDHENDKIGMNLDAKSTLLSGGWDELSNAGRVQRGRPLKGSDFENYTILPIWGVKYGHMTGAIIEFAKPSERFLPHSFGFYVHVGTNQTYTSNNIPTDADRWRGYAGAAAAIWPCTWRFAAEDAIAHAEDAIATAENEGRTKGLGEARQLLQRAENCLETWGQSEIEISYPFYADNFWGTAILRANEAKNVAGEAVTPSFMEVYAMPLIITGMVGIATAVSLVIRCKKKSKKESETIIAKKEPSSSTQKDTTTQQHHNTIFPFPKKKGGFAGDISTATMSAQFGELLKN